MEIQGIGNILSQEGTYTGAVVSDGRLSSCDARDVRVTHKGNSLTVKGIKYGNGTLEVEENWHFAAEIEETFFPPNATDGPLKHG